MKRHSPCLVLILMIIESVTLFGQVDDTPPISPVLDFVTVNNGNGTIELSWSPSPSTDVCGYVIYEFSNGEGFAVDTIKDPSVTWYDKISYVGAGYFSQQYVIAAIDCSDNISPLSNELSTIYVSSVTDTCNNRIGIEWNEYISYPRTVSGYQLYYSVDNGEWKIAGETDRETFEYVIKDFETNSQYYFRVIANLAGDYHSESNIDSVNTKMSRPPSWINADYVSTGPNNNISLSFSIDPESEIKTFDLQRKEGDETEFSSIASLTSTDSHIIYEDLLANPLKNYIYRISAVNNCGNHVLFSNTASNIVLAADRVDDNTINLTWNNYREWLGEISSQSLMANTGSGFYENRIINTGDTAVTVYYNDYMEMAGTGEMLFMIKMEESDNPYGITGKSFSQPVPVKVTEKITVANVFTPDGNGQNDYFHPMLSFVPKDYHLIITDINRKVLFDSRNYLEEWDGRSSGNIVPEGVYLWQLRITTATGEKIEKTGTVTIVFNL